jgi:hypothetical protein
VKVYNYDYLVRKLLFNRLSPSYSVIFPLFLASRLTSHQCPQTWLGTYGVPHERLCYFEEKKYFISGQALRACKPSDALRRPRCGPNSHVTCLCGPRNEQVRFFAHQWGTREPCWGQVDLFLSSELYLRIHCPTGNYIAWSMLSLEHMDKDKDKELDYPIRPTWWTYPQLSIHNWMS